MGWEQSSIPRTKLSAESSSKESGLKLKSGELIAWVLAAKEYATRVDLKDGTLISTCTCPYGINCKHAVAVVLEYLDRLKKKVEVPLIAKKDERLELLKTTRAKKSGMIKRTKLRRKNKRHRRVSEP